MSGLFFQPEPPYQAGPGKQPPPTTPPAATGVQGGLQGLLQNILSGFGLFTSAPPQYKAAPGAAPTPAGGSSGTSSGSSQQLPPTSGGASSSTGTSSGSSTPTSSAPQSITVSKEIACPMITKDHGEKPGAPVEFPWPQWAVRYRVNSFSPVYPADQTKGGKLNAAPVGIDVAARGELAGANPPPSLVLVPTWQSITGAVSEGAVLSVLSVVFEGPSNIPQGSN